MNTQRTVSRAVVLGALSLFVLALVPGQAQAFNPQPEPPAKSQQQAPVFPQSQPRIQPQVIPRAPAAIPRNMPKAGVVAPTNMPKAGIVGPSSMPPDPLGAPTPGQGSAKMGFEPSPFMPKGADLGLGEKGIVDDNAPAPGQGGMGEKGIIVQIDGKPYMPAPQGAAPGLGGMGEKGIIVQKPGLGMGAKGILDDNAPAPVGK